MGPKVILLRNPIGNALLSIAATEEQIENLMQSYLHLDALAAVRPALHALQGLPGLQGLTNIAIRDIRIADCNMTLGAKLRYLREIEGTLRGLGREMTQQEIVRSIKKELGKTISQSYLSQIESGARPASDQLHAHAAGEVLQSASRLPGGRSRRLPDRTDLGPGRLENKLDLWLINGAAALPRETWNLSQALLEWRATRIRACAWCCWEPSWRIRDWPNA